MSDIASNTMNMKLTNEIKSSSTNIKSAESLVKEERRRTGRYIAILVGIMLFILALYHAWVRRIPFVASLVVPALIMFLYVAWVLYTASRDKRRALEFLRFNQHERVTNLQVPVTILHSVAEPVLPTLHRSAWESWLLDMEAALAAQNEADNEIHSPEPSQSLEIAIISSKESSSVITPVERHWTEVSTTLNKNREHNGFIMPIILINDKPPEDLDQKWLNIVEKVTNSDKLKGFHTRRKYNRKFCRKRRYAAFKRSYSIG